MWAGLSEGKSTIVVGEQFTKRPVFILLPGNPRFVSPTSTCTLSLL